MNNKISYSNNVIHVAGTESIQSYLSADKINFVGFILWIRRKTGSHSPIMEADYHYFLLDIAADMRQG